ATSATLCASGSPTYSTASRLHSMSYTRSDRRYRLSAPWASGNCIPNASAMVLPSTLRHREAMYGVAHGRAKCRMRNESSCAVIILAADRCNSAAPCARA
ncbi:MAG: hypothetical protein ACK53Y_08600, partial [bacterium]